MKARGGCRSQLPVSIEAHALTCRTLGPVQGLTLYDEYNDEEITLTKDEIRMIQRIRKGGWDGLGHMVACGIPLVFPASRDAETVACARKPAWTSRRVGWWQWWL